MATPAATPMPPARDPKRHKHLGFFLRANPEVGALGSSPTVDDVPSVTGSTVGLALSVGGAVAENLLLGFEAWTFHTYSASENSGSQTREPEGLSHNVSAFGPTLTYYFMRFNLYVGATPGLGGISTSVEQSVGRATVTATRSSKLGFVSRVFLGKEFWVADHLGLGDAGSVLVGVNPDETESTSLSGRTTKSSFYWTTIGMSVGLSITYS